MSPDDDRGVRSAPAIYCRAEESKRPSSRHGCLQTEQTREASTTQGACDTRARTSAVTGWRASLASSNGQPTGEAFRRSPPQPQMQRRG